MSWFLAFAGFAVLVILHELGHFTAAKAVGMRVEKFSLFFPPTLLSKKVGETEYAIGSIPAGGYVKISGMNPSEDLPEEVRDRAYHSQPVWKRIVVIAAGPAVNLVLAFLLFWVFYLAIGPQETTTNVSSVERNMPAFGVIKPGDKVLAVDGVRGKPARLSEQIQKHQCAGAPKDGCKATTPATVLLERDGKQVRVRLTPVYDANPGTGIDPRTRLGFGFAADGPHVTYGVGKSFDIAADQFWFISKETVKLPLRLINPEQRKEISGVVGSYEATRQTILNDVADAVGILAIISLSLAIVNLFPFLPLDGGHIFWAIVEKVRRKPVPFAVMERAGVVGFMLVILIFLIGLSNDIGRLSGEGFQVRWIPHMSVTSARRTARPAGLGASTIAEAFQLTAAANPDRVALRTKDDEFSMTWGEYADKVRHVAAGLAGLGLERGSSMGIMLTNRPDFHWYDAAALHLGATPFSIYNTYAPEQIQYQVQDAQARVVVTEQAFADRIRGLDGVDHLIVVDDGDDDVESHAPEGFDFEAAWRAVQADDVLTLIYTSGTTGPPKGVQLIHSNVMSAVQGFDEVIAFPNDGRVVSWLPMAHIAERACSHYMPMLLGFTTTDCPDPRQVVAYLPEVRPSWFFAVPRIYEKLKAAIEAGIEAEQDEARKQATKWALDVGLRKVRLEQAGEPLPDDLRAEHAKAEELVLSKIRAKLGLDQLESINVGAAPTPREVIEFFHAIGIPVAELWGMSETTGYGTCNPPDKIKIGTVGPPSPGVEVKLDDDGEVLIRGPVITSGYRNQPDKTREAIDDEGWLHTGDVGEFDEDGYLKIVDRKKELIINAGGKNMSPANIEARVKAASPVIGQVIAIGDMKPFNVALITLDPDVAPAYTQQHGEDALLTEVARGVEAANEQMARVEQIKRYKLLETDWQPGGDELTPTMKLKRKPIHEKYATEIEELYS